MSLPKRNRRIIICEGRRYHWSFPKGRDFDHRSDYQLIVQAVHGGGQVLKVLQSVWPNVTPAFVHAVITDALERGWCPEEALAPFTLSLSETKA